MASTKRVAIVGDGIVAAFASLAASSAGYQPVILSRDGEFSRPPVGAFYLHDLPAELRSQFPSAPSYTTVVGEDPQSYTRRLWGKALPSSVDKFKPEETTVEEVWPFHPEMTEMMFAGAEVLISGTVDADRVQELSKEYSKVIVTVPISFVGKFPRTREILTVKAGQNKFFDAFCETPIRVEQRYGSPLLKTFTETQSFRTRLNDLVRRDPTALYTLYSAEEAHFWLRATRHPSGDGSRKGTIHLELVGDLFTAEAWRERQEAIGWTKGKLWQLFQELRTSLKWSRRDITIQRKIHPEEDLRNEAPADNVLLTGRWATWDRGELSHETYGRVRGWL